MRIKCWKCGHVGIIFTVRGDCYGDHHGAICAHCRKPITLKDCLFRMVVASTQAEEADFFRHPPENLKPLSGMAKSSGKR